MSAREPAAVARQIVDANTYMAIGSADASGLPWVSPVWFAPAGYREFFWVSKPEARHSRNIAARPQVSIVIFDSTVAPGSGEAVYMAAFAEQLAGTDVDRGLAAFSVRNKAQGLREWTVADVAGVARHRLYRATVSEWFILGPRDERVPVELGRAGPGVGEQRQ